MQNKSFEEWEKQKGIFAYSLSKYKSSKQMSEEEFDALVERDRVDFHGVDYKARVEFLTKNGYEVTRENLVNSDLSAKPVEE